MNPDDKQFKEIANKLGMTSKQLIDEVTIRINKHQFVFFLPPYNLSFKRVNEQKEFRFGQQNPFLKI